MYKQQRDKNVAVKLPKVSHSEVRMRQPTISIG